jgi:ribosome-binding protein aMBF1 (putative translation factor)
MSGLMTPSLVRAAREVLGWTTETLASHAELSMNTVNRYQYAKGDETEINVSVGNAKKIRFALERAGIEFINDGRRCGVVFVKPGD